MFSERPSIGGQFFLKGCVGRSADADETRAELMAEHLMGRRAEQISQVMIRKGLKVAWNDVLTLMVEVVILKRSARGRRATARTGAADNAGASQTPETEAASNIDGDPPALTYFR